MHSSDRSGLHLRLEAGRSESVPEPEQMPEAVDPLFADKLPRKATIGGDESGDRMADSVRQPRPLQLAECPSDQRAFNT
ncbi:hypothetical protein KFU94_71005 [Chloroflexi bacterium TSY]|nr:hypothetical protein [Chloroflexi bacterium TSY]